MTLNNVQVRKIVTRVVGEGLSTEQVVENFDVIFQELVPDIDGIFQNSSRVNVVFNS